MTHHMRILSEVMYHACTIYTPMSTDDPHRRPLAGRFSHSTVAVVRREDRRAATWWTVRSLDDHMAVPIC